MNDEVPHNIDEIDREIIRILSSNPRMPYNKLSLQLQERGHEMTGEGVRHRVSKILDATSPFFLFAPGENDWEIVRIGINVEHALGAIDEVYDAVSESDAWLVTKGIGDFDVWAVITRANNRDIQQFLSKIRGIDHVKEVYKFIETNRQTFMDDYFALE